MTLDYPICLECGDELPEPPDDERVIVEYCSSCGARNIITRKLVTKYDVEIEGDDA